MRLRTGAVNRGICNVALQVLGPGGRPCRRSWLIGQPADSAARQTAWGLVNIQLPLASYEANIGASEARDAFVLLLPLLSRGRPGWGLIYLGSDLIRFRPVGWGDWPTCRWRGRQGGKRPCPLDPWPLVYANCREGPGLWDSLHRPVATRHPWRDAPCCGHPDRAPPAFTPPPGPTDGFEFGFICLTSKGGVQPLPLLQIDRWFR